MTRSGSHRRFAWRGFTLVELLVVIGIIAILVAILLPALTRARKQANVVKCAAAMREIARAFTMYSTDNKGKFPVCKFDTNPAQVLYRLPDGTGVTAFYYQDFLLKYTTKNDYYTRGTTGGSSDAAIRWDHMRKSIFWGCPEWQGSYFTGNTKGSGDQVSFSENGYAMNIFPMWKSTTTVTDYAANWKYRDYIAMDSYENNIQNRRDGYHHFRDWSPNAEKALVLECTLWLFWMTPSDPGNHVVTRQPGNLASQAFAYFTGGWNNIDRYRHGVYPRMLPDGTLNDKEGRVSYNILYADGHVSNVSSIKEGFRAVQMRDP